MQTASTWASGWSKFAHVSATRIDTNVKTKTHLSANKIVLEIVPVNPRVVKGFRKHNLIHFCVSFLFAEACYAVSLLCVPMAFFVGYLRGFRWQTQIKGFEEFPRIWTCLNREGRVPSFKQGRMMTQILAHKLNITWSWWCEIVFCKKFR